LDSKIDFMNSKHWLGRAPGDWLQEAATRIQGKVHRTPVMSSRSLDSLTGLRLFFKTENLQRAGSFKIRGASNVVESLQQEQARRGVLTHSSGNFAQGLALAAQEGGIPAYIVIPENAPSIKIQATRGYGAQIRLCAPSVSARELAAKEWQGETGATFVHPYDDPLIIAGQGTAAMELIAEVPDLDFILVPVGGGGLCAGTTIAADAFGKPGLRVLGIEPAGADDAWRSLQSGNLCPQENPQTIADGLRTSLGKHPFDVFRLFGTRILCVEEALIKQAMALLHDRMKLVVEPSGAVPLATLLTENSIPKGSLVGIILSGGNCELVGC
jgi:threonine dehydratase